MKWIVSLLAGLFGPRPAPTVESNPAPVSVNEHAWIETVRACEGTSAPDGYRYLFGSSPSNSIRFEGFERHPNIARYYVDQSGKRIKTTAAGIGQINYPTYVEFGGGLFTPEAQEAMILSITRSCGALEDVRAGRLRSAVEKCGGRWASLPSARVPQPRRSYQFVEAAFRRAGGKISPEGVA